MRNITNSDGSELNVVITNQYEVNLPLEQTKASFLSPILLSLKGLSTIGTSGQIIKVNSGGTALEYANDNSESITVSLPLDRTGDVISLTGLTTLQLSEANKVIKVNATGTALEYATDNNEVISVSLPLNKTTAGLVSLTGLSTLQLSEANKVIKVNATGTALEYGNQISNNNQLVNGALFITASSTDILTNKTIGSFTGNSSSVITTPNSTGTLALTSDIPTPSTQYWSLTGNLLEPTSTYDLQINSVIKIGSSIENYELETNFTNNTFQIKEQDGTNVFLYDSNNGYVDFGTIAGSRMNFGYYILHGTDIDYPSGVSMPFGTISNIYSASAFIRSITTDDLILSQYGASPATITTTLRCNAGGNVVFTRGGSFSNQVVINTSGSGSELSNGTYNYSFPNLDGTIALFSQIPTNNNQLINGSAYITQSSTDTLTNKTIISFTGNSGSVITTPSSTGTLALISDIPSVSGFITASSNDTLTNKTWNSSIISETYGGTNQNSYIMGQILYASATNTLSTLLIGATDQILTVVGGVPSWVNPATPDLTTAEAFGTAVITGNTIKLGTTVSGYSSNLELYFNSTLKFFNTSNVNVATFTVSSSWVNLDLKGGTITNVYIGTNGIWNGDKIEYNYGGTGLSTLTPNKILQINSAGTGYDMIDLPISNTYTGGTDITVSGSNVISYTGSASGSNWTILGVGVNPYLTPLNSGYRWIKLTSIGCDITGSISTVSASTFNISSTSFLTSNSTIRFNALSTLEITHGASSLRKFYVDSAGCQITGNSDIINSSGYYVRLNASNGTQLLKIGTKMEIGEATSGNMYIQDPLSSISTNNWKLYYNTASTLTYVNCGSSSGTTALCVAGTPRLEVSTDKGAFHTSYVYNRANTTGDQIGFTTYLNPSYVNNTYSVLGSDSSYIFISTGQTSGFSSRTGGVYVGYFSSGGWNYVSDSKFKIDVHTLENSLDKINAMRGVSFYWNELSGKPMDDKQVGFIAQEMNEILPEICDYNTKTESWAVDYAKITPVLVEGIKAQQIQIDTLKTELDTVKTELVTVKTELDTVKSELDTYKSLMDKLMIAPSFKSFKESLV